MSGPPELGGVRVASVPPAASADNDEPSLVMSIFRRRKRFVLVTTAVCVLATLLLTASQTKLYSATSTVEVKAPPAPAGAVPNMATEAQIARSTAVEAAAASALHLNVKPGQLLAKVGIFVPADSDILNFTYTSPKPEDAQKGAQAFATAYQDVRLKQFQDTTALAATATSGQINQLKGQLAAAQARLDQATGSKKPELAIQVDSLTTRLSLLQQQLADLNDRAVNFAPAKVVGVAPLPTSPSKPNVLLNVVLGLFGGLMIGFGIAAVAEFLDDRVRSAKDLQARLGTSVVGVIPKGTRELAGVEPTFVALDAPASRTGDAFRRLSTNLVAAAGQARAKSIAITSLDRKDAPPELITNLAVLLAAAGKRVVLITMARRWPPLEEVFGASPGPGFLDVLAGAVPVQHAFAETEFESLLLCRRGRPDLIEIGAPRADDDRPRAVAVPSRAPTYALGSERTAGLVADLGEPFDFVLVDAPALLGDADSAALAGACDAVLAVATPSTDRADIAQSREQLAHVRATVLGSVFIEVGGQPTKGLRRPVVGSARTARDSVKQWVKLPRTGHGRTMR